MRAVAPANRWLFPYCSDGQVVRCHLERYLWKKTIENKLEDKSFSLKAIAKASQVPAFNNPCIYHGFYEICRHPDITGSQLTGLDALLYDLFNQFEVSRSF